MSICAMGCKKDTVIDQRTVTLYTFAQSASQPACNVPPSAFAQYSAAGDFEPDPSTHSQANVTLDEIAPPLDALPATTKQLSVDVTQEPAQWRGFGSVADKGNVGILLWPVGHECSLTTTVDARPGQIVAYDDHHVLVTGGAGLPSFVADLSNGSVGTVSNDIIAPRIHATATAYPSGVVVIGGEVGNQIAQTAEFFENGSFSASPLPLTFPRTHHGAAALRNGNVVVVGGASTSGLYASIEEIDTAAKKEIPLGGFATLSTARKDPIVLALESGDILVAGGTDSSDTPVGMLEWFSGDVTQETGTATIDASSHEAFVALPAGGALGVVSPDTPGPTTVWLIRPDHTVEQAPSIASLPSNAPVKLFSGADGAPMLWTGTSWFRWSPWDGAFAPFRETESVSGGSSAAGPPDGASVAVTSSPDPGLALWLDDSGSLTGLRFDARGAYSTDVKTLLATDTQSIAPDRLPGTSLKFTDAQGNAPGTGLALGAGAQVVVADANYADFSLDLDTGKLETPILFFRDTEAGTDFTIGVDDSVPPKVSCAVPDANHWHVERRSGAVSVSADGAPLSTCATSVLPGSRLTIGLRGRSAPSNVTATARNLVIKRE